MPRDELDKYQVNVDEGPDFLKVFHFLQKNAGELNLREIARVSQQELTSGFSGEEIIKFDLIYMEGGSTVRGEYKTTPNPQNNGLGPGSYQLDLTGISDPKLAAKLIKNFNQVIIETELNCHRANQPLRLSEQSGGRWGRLALSLMREQLKEYADKFQAKGIAVYLGKGKNLDLVIPPPDSSMEQSADRRGPGYVPRGAPDKKAY
ncbi:MAG: hypothetical protein ACHQJ6_04095 [Candidatus Berkiellales bacterium]